MTAREHPLEDIPLLIDGSLSRERMSALDEHLAVCSRCRAEVAALRQVRSTLQVSLPSQPVPAEVVDRIRAAIRAEAHMVAGTPPDAARTSRRVFVQRSAALLAAAAVASLIFRLRPRDFVAEAEADFSRFSTNRLLLDLSTAVPTELENYFQRSELGFTARVFDFGMMGYGLVGGSVHSMGGRDAALFAYRGADGRGLVCQMYPGTIEELPGSPSRQTVNGIDFLIYSRDALALVYWEEGPIVCVLALEADSPTALDLAVAKAVRA
jgi:anti-sigma factor RsiW